MATRLREAALPLSLFTLLLTSSTAVAARDGGTTTRTPMDQTSTAMPMAVSITSLRFAGAPFFASGPPHAWGRRAISLLLRSTCLGTGVGL